MAFSLANQARSAFRAALNVILASLESASLSATAPTAPATGRVWLDSSPGAGVWLKKRWDGGDWILEGTYDTVANTFVAASSETAFPIGGAIEYYGDTAPTNFAFAYGQALSRTTYATLFVRYGVKYGAGDGSTTFNMPDRRGRVGIGRDDMGGSAASRVTAAGSGITGTTLGAVGGEQTHTLSAAEQASMPLSAQVTDPSLPGGGSATGNMFSVDPAGSVFAAPPVTITGTATGGGGAHNNMPPGIVCNVIIRVL